MLAVGIVGDLVALNVLPQRQVVIGLAAAYGLVTLTGAIIAWPLLLRRVGSLDGWKITRSLVRMFLATLPGLVFILATMAVLGSMLHAGPVYGLVTTIIGGGGALALYAICAPGCSASRSFVPLIRSVAMRLGRLCNAKAELPVARSPAGPGSRRATRLFHHRGPRRLRRMTSATMAAISKTTTNGPTSGICHRLRPARQIRCQMSRCTITRPNPAPPPRRPTPAAPPAARACVWKASA